MQQESDTDHNIHEYKDDEDESAPRTSMKKPDEIQIVQYDADADMRGQHNTEINVELQARKLLQHEKPGDKKGRWRRICSIKRAV